MGVIMACRTTVVGSPCRTLCEWLLVNAHRLQLVPQPSLSWKSAGAGAGPVLAKTKAASWCRCRTSVVFTLPAAVGEIAFRGGAVVYAILFRAAAETLATIAADPRHLGFGMTMVLHTWGQTLGHHPHVHCVVPGGGPSLDGSRWVACGPGFFLPVRGVRNHSRRKL